MSHDHVLRPALLGLAGLLLSTTLAAQPLTKQVFDVDPGNTKAIGETFSYRLSYNCSNISDPCVGASVVDLLPAEVELVSTVPSRPLERQKR